MCVCAGAGRAARGAVRARELRWRHARAARAARPARGAGGSRAGQYPTLLMYYSLAWYIPLTLQLLEIYKECRVPQSHCSAALPLCRPLCAVCHGNDTLRLRVRQIRVIGFPSHSCTAHIHILLLAIMSIWRQAAEIQRGKVEIWRYLLRCLF